MCLPIFVSLLTCLAVPFPYILLFALAPCVDAEPLVFEMPKDIAMAYVQLVVGLNVPVATSMLVALSIAQA